MTLLFTAAQQMAKLPVIRVPAGFRFQPVDAGEVAGRLVELTLGTPAGLVPDMGGPRVYGVAESAPRVPAGARQAPDDGAGPDPRQGRRAFRGGRKSSPNGLWVTGPGRTS